MTNENGNGMYMPVAPAFGYGGNGGFGFGDGNGWWIILLLLLAGNGMWGGFGGGGMMWPMMMGGMGGFGLGYDFPWLLNGQQGINNNVSDGFRDAQLNSGISAIQGAVASGFGDTALGIAGINQNICQTGGQVTAAVTNGFAQAEIADNARQMANMQQAFNAQTATTAAVTGVSSQLAKCCCDQELATANLAALVQRENCADREALSNGIRDLITNQNASTQRIIDQLCQDKIDAKNERIQELQTQLNMANLAASQTAQTARLLADNAAQTQAIENYVRPQINPAYIVPNPYAYNFYPNGGWNNGGCGCGSNGFGSI